MSEPRKQPKLELDLETAFLPSWAQKSSKANPYSKHEDREPPSPSRRKDSRQSTQKEKPQPKAKERRSKDSSEKNKQPRPQSRSSAPQSPKPDRKPTDSGKLKRSSVGDVRQAPKKTPLKYRSREELEKIIASLPNLKLSILPDPKRVKSLADKIRQQGRAYSLFDIAVLVLQRPDRFQISATILRKGPGKPVSEQWLCQLDDTLWLSQDAAVKYTVRKYFDKFYKRVRTKIDPPKGNFAFVAQCGISGKILGPPNYHGYQKTLQDLHAEQCPKMNFQAYKDRVKIVHDEEAVQKWLDDQSWKTEYQTKSDASMLASMDEVTAHFKTHHLKETLKTNETLRLSATAGLQNSNKAVRKLIQFYLEDQQKFPLESATILGRMFSRQGLHVFKFARNDGDRPLLYISVARPHYLNKNEILSKEIQRIMDFVRSNPDCTRKKLVESLRPQTESKPASLQSSSAEEPSSSSAKETEAAPAISAVDQWTPEEKAIITDLHWLIHEGHVIEFSDGKIETAKKPPPGEKPHRSASDGKTKGKTAHTGKTKSGGKSGKSRRKQTRSTPAKSH